MKRIIIPGILAAAVTGQHLDVARLHGHVVVLNFWGRGARHVPDPAHGPPSRPVRWPQTITYPP